MRSQTAPLRIFKIKRAPVGRAVTLLQGKWFYVCRVFFTRTSLHFARKRYGSIAGEPLDRMFGHETVTAGIAGPEIADDGVVEVGRSLRRDHGVRANRTGRQITSARVGVRRDGQDFSNCWHRDLLCVLNRGSGLILLVEAYTDLFDDVATQMRTFRVI